MKGGSPFFYSFFLGVEAFVGKRGGSFLIKLFFLNEDSSKLKKGFNIF